VIGLYAAYRRPPQPPRAPPACWRSSAWLMLPVIRFLGGVVELAAPGPDHPRLRRVLDGRQHARRRCWWMVVGTQVSGSIGSLLARARADNLRREAGKDWVGKLAEASR
jgi:hypothetical protein